MFGGTDQKKATGGIDLPSGEVAFVFTDIEGSTRLLRSMSDEQAAATFERHDELLHAVWQANGGAIMGSEGDSHFVAFADTGAAVVACAQAQRSLAVECWPQDVPLRVRMGIHVGLAAPRRGGYVALAVHQANRVMSAAHGGQILITDNVVRRVDASGLAGLGDLVPLGKYRIRDFDDPVELTRVDPRGLVPSENAIRAVPASQHNIMASPSSFVGRELERIAVNGLIRPGAVVSLVGPGGVGKTRLAAEIGLELAGDWPHGVWMVDLAEVTDSELVPNVVAATLGAPVASHHRDAREAVLDYLESRNLLLILDTVEHHVEACGRLLAELMRRGTRLAVVTTGRTPLHIPGETVFRVNPFVSDGRTAEGGSDAVRLFVDRAKAVRPDLAQDPITLKSIAEVCRAVDGLPLAIEIAAARVAMMSPEELLESLGERGHRLCSSDPTLPDRHQSLNDLIGWSVRLLSESERLALSRLALFEADFGIWPATAALGANLGPTKPAWSGDAANDIADRDAADLDHGTTVDLVWSLLDKSLLTLDLSEARTRYRLPQMVRSYVLTELAYPQDLAAAAPRLAARYLDRLGPWMASDRRTAGDTGIELSNLRGLADRLAEPEPDLAQQLMCAIGRHHDVVNTLSAGISELERAATRLDHPAPSRVVLLVTLAELYLRRDDTIRAAELIEQADRLRDSVGEPWWAPAVVERSRCEVAIRAGDPSGAEKLALETLKLRLPAASAAALWNRVGIARFEQADWVGAYDAFDHELRLFTEADLMPQVGGAHCNLAEIALRLGDRATAATHQLKSLENAVALGRPLLVGNALVLAGRIAPTEGEWAGSYELLLAGEALFSAVGYVLYREDRRSMEQTKAAAAARLSAAELQKLRVKARHAPMLDSVARARRILERVAGSDGPTIGESRFDSHDHTTTPTTGARNHGD